MIHFLCGELKKKNLKIFFKFNKHFSNGTATTNKLDDGIPVTHFSRFKYLYSKRYLNYRFDYSNTFFRT